MVVNGIQQTMKAATTIPVVRATRISVRSERRITFFLKEGNDNNEDSRSRRNLLMRTTGVRYMNSYTIVQGFRYLEREEINYTPKSYI